MDWPLFLLHSSKTHKLYSYSYKIENTEFDLADEILKLNYQRLIWLEQKHTVNNGSKNKNEK